MIRPRSLLEVVAWICIPSTVTGSKCSGERRKLMVSSLVFSRFSWNKFSADQLETWSTASCALLCCPFGTFSDKVVSSTYFHIPKSALGVKRSLIISKKSHGPNLVPWGTPAGTAWLLETPGCPLMVAGKHPALGLMVKIDATVLIGPH